MGIHGDPNAIGDPDHHANLRLASVALLLESQSAISASLTEAIARESEGDSSLSKLAALAAARARKEAH